MARIMSRSRSVADGSSGMKFSEVIVIAMAIAGIVIGVRWYLDYRHSPSYALQEYVAAVKSGNVGAQYALIDETDKKNFFPSQGAYENKCTLAHGYTERVENSTVGTEQKSSDHPDKVTLPLTVAIRATVGTKQLYEVGQTQSYSDKIVMRLNGDGNWRVMLSASIDKSTGKLHMQDATPSPTSTF